MIRLALVVLLITIQGCSFNPQITANEQPPFPLQAQGSCCWQALQIIKFSTDGQELSVQAVLANTENKLSLVLLDPMGRRLFSLVQHSSGDIDIKQNHDVEYQLPARLLLSAVYLSYWPSSSWQQSLLGSGWKLKTEGRRRSLAYKNQEIMRVNTAQTRGPIPGQEVIILTHQLKGFSAEIETLERINLN